MMVIVDKWLLFSSCFVLNLRQEIRILVELVTWSLFGRSRWLRLYYAFPNIRDYTIAQIELVLKTKHLRIHQQKLSFNSRDLLYDYENVRSKGHEDSNFGFHCFLRVSLVGLRAVVSNFEECVNLLNGLLNVCKIKLKIKKTFFVELLKVWVLQKCDDISNLIVKNLI